MHGVHVVVAVVLVPSFGSGRDVIGAVLQCKQVLESEEGVETREVLLEVLAVDRSQTRLDDDVEERTRYGAETVTSTWIPVHTHNSIT